MRVFRSLSCTKFLVLFLPVRVLDERLPVSLSGCVQEAWWGSKPELKDATCTLRIRPSTQDVNDKSVLRELSLVESAKKLEALMLKKTFQDGDQVPYLCCDHDRDKNGKGNFSMTLFHLLIQSARN